MALTGAISVLGGGIGGLAAAIALAQRGADVTVYEQAEAITEVGAGLQMSPNAMRVLRALGVADQVLSRAVLASKVSLRRAESDVEVARVPLETGTYAFVHRADLIDILEHAARRAGVSIAMSHKAVALQDGERAQIGWADGTQAHADLVIDASGLHSAGRAALNPASKPFFTGQVAWRAIVPNRFGRAGDVQVHMAPGGHVVSYPLRGGALLNLVAVQERSAWAEEGWAHADDPANMRAAFASGCTELDQMLAAVEQTYVWGLFRHPVAARWHGASLALLGDAAHPTLPFLAQGAAMALEDSWALAACLDALPKRSAALARYQQVRAARVERVIEAANKNAWRYHLPRGPVRLAAHIGLKTLSSLAPSAMTVPFKWLYDYDVTREVP